MIRITIQAFKAPTAQDLEEVKRFEDLLSEADKIILRYKSKPSVWAKLSVRLNEFAEKTRNFQ
jgi:hypothetical protein